MEAENAPIIAAARRRRIDGSCFNKVIYCSGPCLSHFQPPAML